MGKLFVYLFTLFFSFSPIGQGLFIKFIRLFQKRNLCYYFFFVLDDHIAYVFLLCKANP